MNLLSLKSINSLVHSDCNSWSEKLIKGKSNTKQYEQLVHYYVFVNLFPFIKVTYLKGFLNTTEHSANRTYDNSLIRRALYHWVICPLVGMAGLEPTHVCIKNKRLTAWLHSIISFYIVKYNRDGVIRTRDLLNPNQIRYQATLHPVL